MRRKFNRKSKRKKNRAQILLLLLLVLASVILASRVMVVKKVVVVGNSRYSDYSIIEMAQVPYGKSIFTIDTEAISHNFLRNGYVEFISAKVSFPNILELTIRERTARAMVDCMGVYAIVDENCVVIEQHSVMPNYLLPTVTGVKLSRYRVGEVIKSTESGQIETICEVIKAIYEDGCENEIAELNASDLDNLYLMGRGGIMIVFGDGLRLSEKLSKMHSAIDELKIRGTTSGKLDVSGSNAIFSQSQTPQ